MTPVAEVDYVEEAGPGILELPEGAPAEQQPVDGPEVLEPALRWEQDAVEDFLKGGGAILHLMIGAGEEDWKMTLEDLERIAPPLTRIANRWEPLAQLAPYADPLLVAKGFAIYGWRSALETARAKRDAQASPTAPREGYVRDQEPAGEQLVDEPVDAGEQLPADYAPPGRYFDENGSEQ